MCSAVDVSCMAIGVGLPGRPWCCGAQGLKALFGFPTPQLLERLNKRLSPSTVHLLYVTPRHQVDDLGPPAPPRSGISAAEPHYQEDCCAFLSALSCSVCSIPQQQGLRMHCPKLRHLILHLTG